MKNYYDILGVEINSTSEQIKTAYRKLAIKFHPDKNSGDKYFEERFKEIQTAYDTLINENSRNQYNTKLFTFFQKVSSSESNQKQQQARYEKPTYKQPNQTTRPKKSRTPVILLIIFLLSTWFILKQVGGKYNNFNDVDLKKSNDKVVDQEKDIPLSKATEVINEDEKLNSEYSNLLQDLERKYDLVTGFSDGMILVSLKNKYGFLNERGEIVVPVSYEIAMPFNEGLAAVKKNGMWGYINKSGSLVIPYSNYTNVRSFSEGFAAVQVNYKNWGYINKFGNEVISAKYEDAKDFSNGFAGVGINITLSDINGNYGFVNRYGQEIVPLIYKRIVKNFTNKDGIVVAELKDENENSVWVGDDGRPAMWEN